MGIRFQGLNAHTIARQYIKATENGWYTVQSQTIRGEYYSVNTIIGFCTCPRGTNGSPRVHQAAVVIQCGEYGLNFISSASSSSRQTLAQVALGEGAIKDSGFYSSLHQESLEGTSTCQNNTPDITCSQWFVQVSKMEVKTRKFTTRSCQMWKKHVNLLKV